MITERIAMWLYKLDRWQETSNRVARIRRWVTAHVAHHWTKRFNKIQDHIRDLQCLHAQILLSGTNRKIPKTRKRLAYITREVDSFAGTAAHRDALKHELSTLNLVCNAQVDPNIPRSDPLAAYTLKRAVRPAI